MPRVGNASLGASKPRLHRGPCGFLFLLVLFVVSVLFEGAASAGKPPFLVKLKFEVDPSLPGCGDETDFRKKVTRRVGADPFRDEAQTTVTVRVEGPAWSIGGDVHWQDAQGATMGERRFIAKDGNCGKLLAEMGFAVALQIQMLGLNSVPDNGAIADGSVVDGSGTDGPGTNVPIDVPPSPPEVAPQSPRPPISLWLGLGPQLALGLAPSSLWQGRVSIGLRIEDFSFEFASESHQTRTYRRWGGSGFREWVFESSLAACHHWGMLSGCVLGKAGTLHFAGAGLDVPLSPSAFLAHAGARVAATYDLSRSWFVAAHLDCLALLTPKTIVMNDAAVWSMPKIAAMVGLDLAVRFR